MEVDGEMKKHWSGKIFSVGAWISGRTMIVGLNIIFVTQMRVFWSWFVGHAPASLYTGDIIEINNKIHVWAAIWLVGVPVMIHVWVLAVPWLFAGADLDLLTNWLRPKGVSFYSDDLHRVSLGMNDSFRLILMTVLFLCTFPLSVSGYMKKRNFTLATWVHFISGMLFVVDILRINTHPHSHWFNTPVVVFWLIYRFVGVFYYRKVSYDVVNILNVDEDYCIVFHR
eukprot:UN25766